MNYEKCFNCGADYGLHQSETEHCPRGGREEIRKDEWGNYRKQEWEETTFLDASIRKLELAAPQMLKALKEIAKGKSGRYKKYRSESGSFQCHSFPSDSSALEEIVDIAKDAIKEVEG